jgi:hypothetical protein
MIRKESLVLFSLSACMLAQTAATLPTDKLISEPGPAFRILDNALSSPAAIIAYGDTRFTDPANVRSTNPKVRRWLVEKIASEKPAAIVINGDLPLAGDVTNDYAVYKTETQIWRDNGIASFRPLAITSSMGPRNKRSKTGGTRFRKCGTVAGTRRKSARASM